MRRWSWFQKYDLKPVLDLFSHICPGCTFSSLIARHEESPFGVYSTIYSLRASAREGISHRRLSLKIWPCSPTGLNLPAGGLLHWSEIIFRVRSKRVDVTGASAYIRAFLIYFNTTTFCPSSKVRSPIDALVARHAVRSGPLHP